VWREFVKGRSTSIPGPIKNEDIIGEDGELAEGLAQRAFTTCDATIWNYLHNIYGGNSVKYPHKSTTTNPSQSDSTSSPMCSKSEQTDSAKEPVNTAGMQLDSKSQERSMESWGKTTKL